MRNSLLHGWLPCLLAVTVWGTTFATTKQLLAALPATEILALRFAIGYAALWALAPRRLRWMGWRAETRMAVGGALGIALYFFFENHALAHARAGIVAVIVCTSPLLTALIERALGRTARLGPGYWLGFALAIMGVTLTVTDGDWGALRGAWQGVALAALGAAAWSAYTVVGLPSGDGLAITRRTFLWGLLAMIPLCLPELGAWRATPLADGGTLGRLLFLGLMASALCYVAWNRAVAVLGGLRASLPLYLNPVVGVLAAAAILNEPLDGLMALGVTLTLMGVALSAFVTRRNA